VAPRFRIRSILLATLCSLLACSQRPEQTRLTPAAGTTRSQSAPPNTVIGVYGSLDALSAGGIGPSLWLSSLRADPSLVGLGSLSELRGEVLVLGGEVWLGYPAGPSGPYARKLGDSDETTAFLVTASVPQWSTLSLVRDIAGANLEESVEQLGRDAGLDVERPFPIVIEGTLRNLEFNVVNGRGFETGKPIPRVTLMAAASRSAIDSVQGVLVGFYGKHAQGQFVHPETRLHVHVLLPDERQVGHVDFVEIPAGATIRVPAPRR